MQKVDSFPSVRADYDKKYRRMADGNIWRLDPTEFGTESSLTLQSRISNKEFRVKYGKFRTRRHGRFLYVQKVGEVQ